MLTPWVLFIVAYHLLYSTVRCCTEAHELFTRVFVCNRGGSDQGGICGLHHARFSEWRISFIMVPVPPRTSQRLTTTWFYRESCAQIHGLEFLKNGFPIKQEISSLLSSVMILRHSQPYLIPSCHENLWPVCFRSTLSVFKITYERTEG